MGIFQIILISLLAVVQLFAFIILVKNMSISTDFVITFLMSSILIFVMLITFILRINDYNKQERIYPQYEEIKDKVFRLK